MAARESGPDGMPASRPRTTRTTPCCSRRSTACRRSDAARATSASWPSPSRPARIRRAAVPLTFTQGTCRGRIATAPRGTGGFGYDPIFEPASEPPGGQTLGLWSARPEARDLASRPGRAPDVAAPRRARVLTAMAGIRSLCVFCGASPGSDPRHMELARDGRAGLAERGIGVVYGGGRVGLMGALADAALAAGGDVTGIIPRRLVDRELAHPGRDDARRRRDAARAKGRDGPSRRRLHRPAGRAGDPRGARRGRVVGPARPARQADRPARRRRLLGGAARVAGPRGRRKASCSRTSRVPHRGSGPAEPAGPLRGAGRHRAIAGARRRDP